MPRQAAFTFVVKAAFFLFDDDILAAMLYEDENKRM